MAFNGGTSLSVLAELRSDLYTAHVSPREKYKLKKEIMPDSVCGSW